MKNVFLMLVVLAISFASVSVSGSVRIKPYVSPDQYSWEEHAAANLWQRSKSLNSDLLKWNRGFIYEGDLLLLAYPQVGDSLWAPVLKGDYPLKVSKRVVIDQPQKYNYSGDDNNNAVSQDDNAEPSALAKFLQALKSLPMWPWILLLIAAGIAIMMGKEQKAKQVNQARNADPITAGNPQVSGGVPDAGAHQRFMEIAEERFPSATFVVKKMYRGILNGPAVICYGGEPSQEKILKNIDAYEGVTVINGKEESIFFLQGCGNDARRGDFMKDGGGLVFTRQFEILPDGTEIPVDADGNRIVTETSETVEEKMEVTPPAQEKKVIILSQRTELDKLVIAQAQLAQEFMSSNNAHKVTMKTTLENGMSSEITLEAKIEPKTQPQQKNESSEGSKK